MKRFYFYPKNAVYAFDVYAENEKKARRWIRGFLGLKTLHGVAVWES
jgi:hypothetical protein